MAAGKERILRLRDQVEALEAQLVDARSSLATFKVCGVDLAPLSVMSGRHPTAEPQCRYGHIHCRATAQSYFVHQGSLDSIRLNSKRRVLYTVMTHGVHLSWSMTSIRRSCTMQQCLPASMRGFSGSSSCG